VGSVREIARDRVRHRVPQAREAVDEAHRAGGHEQYVGRVLEQVHPGEREREVHGRRGEAVEGDRPERHALGVCRLHAASLARACVPAQGRRGVAKSADPKGCQPIRMRVN
jgi:hypothetical protein